MLTNTELVDAMTS